MNATNVKVTLSIAILVAICVISPMIGLSASPVDEREGVMIDYGYYNVDWVPMELESGTDGVEALEKACEIKRGEDPDGYVIEKDVFGSVTSVNGYPNMVSSSWAMYVLRGDGSERAWVKESDPYAADVGSENIIAWARTADTASMMPAVDRTGYTYYSYAEEGKTPYGDQLRVVSMAPSVTETVVAVGGLDLIVATDKYSNYPAELKEKQNSGEVAYAGGYTDPNYELIVSAKPDLVFLDGSVGEHLAMADKLRKSGINTVVLYEVVEVSDLLKNIWISASAIGMSMNGNEYNKQLAATIDSICAITNIQTCKSFISLSTSESPYVAGSGTYADSILTAVGATNVFSGVNSWGIVDKESIYVSQPDVIIVIYEGGEITSAKEYNDVLRSLNSTWKETPAFSTKSIYLFSGAAADLLSRPGARLGAAVELVAKAIDQEAFKAQDYWDPCPNDNHFYGDDYKKYLYHQGPSGVLLT